MRHEAGPDPAAADGARVILFVADGAGVTAWSAGYLAAGAAGRALAVAGLPVTGLVASRNTSRRAPESASSASALATGVATYYRAVSVGPDSLPRTTVLEAAEAAGLATGVVTTTTLVDATPAAFLAHARHRYDDQAAIAEQIAASPAEVLMGDGRGWFDGSLRPDGRDLLSSMTDRFSLVESGDDLRAVDPGEVDALLGLFSMDLLRDPARRDPSLAEMTRAALQVLDRDPDGFFLLVENEHTDHSSHENLPQDVIAAEILSLDDAVAEALAYQREHPETLVIVASDHETGGMALLPQEGGGVEARWPVTGHTATLVPVFAKGPGAEGFGGFHEMEEIGRLLMAAVGAAPE